VPSGIGSTVTIEPEGAAIATAKILALEDKALETRVKAYQSSKKQAIQKANGYVKNLK
jgi:phosphoribosylcarboxyaminoimidazole (NCAIR) mutase